MTSQVLQDRQRKRRNRIIFLVGHYAILLLFAFIFAFPLLFMLMSSLKNDTAIFEDVRSLRAFLPVGEISLENYRLVFGRSPFWLYFKDSLIITLVTVLAGLLINSMAAFALSRLRWKGQVVVLAAIIATLIIPFDAIAIPLLFMTSQLPWLDIGLSGVTLERSWLNTLHVQIVPFIASAFSIFLFYQFFLDIPKEIDEAARVDGASPWRNLLGPHHAPLPPGLRHGRHPAISGNVERLPVAHHRRVRLGREADHARHPAVFRTHSRVGADHGLCVAHYRAYPRSVSALPGLVHPFNRLERGEGVAPTPTLE